MMTTDARQKLKNLLISHEQLKQFPYTDSTGHFTIGVGRNLTDRGISTSEALYLLNDDILYFTSQLSNSFPYFNKLDDIRKIVLIDMCFNLGIRGFLEFNRLLEAITRNDWEEAAKEILDSKAATQCPERYKQLAYIMKSGEL